jgi:hypothetical protein
MYSPEPGAAVGTAKRAKADKRQKAFQYVFAMRIVNIGAPAVGTTDFSFFCFPQAGNHSKSRNGSPPKG